MTQNSVRAILLFSVVLLAAVFYPQVSAEMPEPGTVTVFEEIGESDGRYHLFVPASFDGKKKLPLVYAFHSSGNGRSMVDRLQQAADRYGWMIAGCDKMRNRMDPEVWSGIAREIMEDAESRVPVDPDRIYLTGLSGGAMGAYMLSRTFDRRFAGIIAFAGWLGNYDEENVYPAGMAVAIVNGRQDRGAERVRPKDTAILESHGVIVRPFLFDGGHTIPGTETIEQAVGWLESLSDR